MVSQPPKIDSLFDAVLQIKGAQQRAQFLEQQCVGNPHIREEVERLLKSHEEDPSLLDQTPHSFAPPETSWQQGRSVLQAIGNTFGIETGMELKEVDDELEEPVQQISSPEIPQRDTTGRYQLFGEIARGGMGAVIKGRDTDLGRDLAVKVLLEQHRQSPEVVQRFVEEAQIGGQLQHPGIAPVYELGQFEDQRPFFTMKLVKGKTLAAHLAARKNLDSDRSKLIGIFEQVCQTMAYAHSRGVIHRDLKPANIMVGAFGEVQVMDWGLAKVLSAGGVADERKANEAHQDRSIIETLRSTGTKSPSGSGSQTQMGSVMGTPAYMPPEQALGEIDQLDQRSDVFALGAILCEIITGKPPYVADDSVQVFRLASRGKLNDCYQRLEDCNADPELISLAKECLADEPTSRPSDAGNLADRILDYQETVETRLRDSEIDRAAQTVRANEERKRRRVSMALAFSIVASVLTLSGGGLWIQSQKTVHAENVARKQEQLASAANQLANEEKEKSRIQQAANQELRWVLYQSDIRRAQTEIAQGNFAEAKSILKNHLPKNAQRDLRGFEWHFLYRQCPKMTVSQPFQWEGHVPIIEPRRNEVQGQYTEYFYHEMSRDGNRIAAVMDDTDAGSKKIVVWNTRTGKQEWTKVIAHQGDNFGIKLSHDGNRVAVASGSEVRKEYQPVSHEIQIWDTSNDRIIGNITPQHIPWLKDYSFDFSFRPGDSSIAISKKRLNWLDERETAQLWLWNYATKSRQFEIDVPDQFEFDTLGFSPDGRWLVVRGHAGSHESLHLFDADSGLQKWESSGLASRNLSEAVFSPDGTKLASVAVNRTKFTDPNYEKRDTLLIWDTASGRIEVTAELQLGFARVKFSPSGKLALLYPKTPVFNTEVVRVSDGAKVFQIDKHMAGIWKFSADERFVQAIDHTGTARLWELPAAGFGMVNHQPGWCSLSGDGSRFINKKWDDLGIAHVYDANGRLIRTMESRWKTNNWTSRGLLNHDGSLLITNTRDSQSRIEPITTTLWDIERNQKVAELYQGTSTEIARYGAMSPTESKLATIIAMSGDEEFDRATILADGAEGGFQHASHELRIWNLTTLSEQTIPLDGEASRVGYSHDGKQIAIYATHHAGATKTSSITIIDSASGKTVKKLDVAGSFDRFEFSHDRRYLVGRMRPFDEQPESPIQGAQSEIWDLQTGKRKTVIAGDQAMIFSPDGNRLLSIDTMDGTLLPRLTNVFAIWDVETGIQLLNHTYPDNDVRPHMGFRFLPDQHVLMGFGYRGPPQFWDGTPVDVSVQ